jgi:hypothetical protein
VAAPTAVPPNGASLFVMVGAASTERRRSVETFTRPLRCLLRDPPQCFGGSGDGREPLPRRLGLGDDRPARPVALHPGRAHLVLVHAAPAVVARTV